MSTSTDPNHCASCSRTFRVRRGMQSLRGKRVVVCGGSTGIGREMAIKYGAAGARVLVASRSKPVLDEVAAVAIAAGAMEALVFPVDLSSEDGCAELVKFAVTQMGGVLLPTSP